MRNLWMAHFPLDFALPIAPAERECAALFARQIDLVGGVLLFLGLVCELIKMSRVMEQ